MNLSLTHRIAATTVALAIPLTGIVGGIVGTDIQRAEQTAAIDVHNFVTEMVTAAETRLSDNAGVQARTADTAFQPVLDQALALVETSVGKASDASRTALSEAVSAYVSGYRDASFEDGRDALSAQGLAQETAQTAIDTASQTVTDEVAAWQAAEDARIAEEQAAAERAAEEARESSSNSTSRSTNGGSSGGSTNGGGGDLYDYARELAAQYGVGISFRSGSVSTVSGGGIILAEAAMTSRDRVKTTFLHEYAHAITSDIVWSAPDRQACIRATNAVGVEQTAQWITSRKFGFTVSQYPVPDLAALDAACGAP